MPPFDARRGAEAGFPAIPAVPIAIGFHHPPQLSVIDRFFWVWLQQSQRN
jgi:hypothetical protein